MTIQRSAATVMAVLAVLAGAEGCAAESASAGGATVGESDLVGVTDLAALEEAFGLQKDTQINGAWSRGDDKLLAGRCYSERFGTGASEPQNWELRRYTTGAAFFRTLNSGPASGDKRPVACVDIDDSGFGAVALDGFMLDAAIRYRLGKPDGSRGAAGHSYISFGDAMVEVRDASRFCGILAGPGKTGLEPGYGRYNQEYNRCIAKGENECERAGYDACVDETTADAKRGLLERPSWDDAYVVGFTSLPTLAPTLAMVVYKFALKKGHESDIFSTGDDPIGAFVKMEGTGDASKGWTVARFEHMDAHRMVAWGEEALLITPKESDNTVNASAIVSCTRPIGENGSATGDFTCSGI